MVYEMNRENPVAFLTFCAQVSHPVRIVGVNIQRDFIAGDSLVGPIRCPAMDPPYSQPKSRANFCACR